MLDSHATYPYRPAIFALDSPQQREAYKQMKAGQSDFMVIDTLEDQVVELLVTRNPRLKSQPEKLAGQIRKEVGNGGWESYGTWSWYPWLNTWVRLLPEEAFVEVRTNRNRNKITTEEQQHLQSKRVGIVGLSVGSAVAMVLAMERICGGLKLVDFDTIELSNLNRIPAGVHRLGLPKTVALARAIAEIDPFFEVELIHEGFTPSNANQVFEEIDLVVDACDQVQAKANLRWFAKSQKIPLVMETSDRGMLDVERYDDPSQPFLHGRISEAMLEEMRDSSEWRPEFFDAFIDVKAASTRGVDSLKRVGDELVGWPQLYSDVAGGGAHVAQVIRKILLGERVVDARHYLEWDEQLLESVH